MNYRVPCFIIGYIFLIIGNIFVLLYLNLFSLGYSLFQYIIFILTNYPCFFLSTGLILIYISLHKGEKRWFIYMTYY